MGWFAFGLLSALVLVLAIFAWVRWIAPWRRIETLAAELGNGQIPRTFLPGGNLRARRVGLALEKLWHRQVDLGERVRKGESSVEAILGGMLDGLLVVDGRRRVEMANPAFSRLFEIDDSPTGVTLLETLRDAEVDRLVTDTLRTGDPQRTTLQLARRSGETLAIEVSAMSLQAESQETRGALVLFRDITQMQRVEEMRRDFVANVSHELRTPLSIFRGYLETLLENPKQPRDELLRIFEVMEKHSDRLNLLVEDILSLARLEDPGSRLNYTEVYVPDFLTAILQEWERRFEAKLLRPTLEAPADLPVLSADESRLQEVIYNLLDNAVKYSQPEGRITVKASRDGDRIRLAISDQGSGVPARDLPRIFERFYRADKARSREVGGTGLGLSIVKHIAQLHGGNVEAESEFGRGTTISVVLPIRPPER